MSPRRRILMMSPWYPTTENPIEGIFVERFVRAMSVEHDLAVVAPVMKRSWRVASPLADQERDGVPVRRPVVRVVIPRRLTWMPTARRYEAAVLRSVDHLVDEWGSPDLVHAHVALPTGWAAVSVARHLRVPVVITEHTGPFSANLHNGSARSLTLAALEHADSVVAVSPALATEMQSALPTLEPVIVGNLVDTEFFVPPPTPRGLGDELRMLFVGSLTHVKGPDLLIAAIRRMMSAVKPRLRLTIIGDGPMKPGLIRDVKHAGLGDAVEFRGSLDREALRSAMWEADLLVSTSRHETFGLAIAEAAATALPVIATRTGGASFVLDGHDELLVDIGVEPVADGLCQFVAKSWPDSGSLRTDIIARFSPRVIVGRTSALYDTLQAREVPQPWPS